MRVSQCWAFGGFSPRASVVLRKFLGLRGHRQGAPMLTEGEGSRPGSHTRGWRLGAAPPSILSFDLSGPTLLGAAPTAASARAEEKDSDREQEWQRKTPGWDFPGSRTKLPSSAVAKGITHPGMGVSDQDLVRERQDMWQKNQNKTKKQRAENRGKPLSGGRGTEPGNCSKIFTLGPTSEHGPGPGCYRPGKSHLGPQLCCFLLAKPPLLHLGTPPLPTNQPMTNITH